jgi:hypothetical protein
MEQPRIDQLRTKAKRPRPMADGRLPRLGLRPLDPERRLLPTRPRKKVVEWQPDIASDLSYEMPISTAELDAILQLLGNDLASILGE